VSVRISPGGDHVAVLDAEQVEQIDLITAKRTKKNSQKWVGKKREFQVDNLDQLKLKTVILYNDYDCKIYMTQPVGLVLGFWVKQIVPHWPNMGMILGI